jgi:hypothetical protein
MSGAGREADSDIVDGGDPRTRSHYHYRRGQLVVAADDIARIKKKLWKQGVRVQEEHPLDEFGLVLLRVEESDGGLPKVVEGMRDTWDGSTPRVAVNHLFRLLTHTQISAWPPLPTEDRLPPPGEVGSAPGRGVIVGVIDGGADLDNEWFAGRCTGDTEDPVEEDGRLSASSGHGTFAVGVILRHAPGARVVVRRVVDHEGVVDDFELARALGDLAHVDVITLPIGAYAHRDRGVLAVEQALRHITRQHPDLVLVASAGNDATDRPMFPAAYKQVIGVGAVERVPESGRWRRACFSNSGWWVDACAPGVNVLSTFLRYSGELEPREVLEECRDRTEANDWQGQRSFHGWARWSGTSFAAPAVAGAIARRISQGSTGREAVAHLIDSPHARRIPEVGALVTAASYAEEPRAS